MLTNDTNLQPHYTKNVTPGVDPQKETGATTLSDGKKSDLTRVPQLS